MTVRGVSASIPGIPFVRVERGVDTLSVDMAPVPDSNPVVELWSDSDAHRRELPMKIQRMAGVVLENAPLSNTDDVFFEVTGGRRQETLLLPPAGPVRGGLHGVRWKISCIPPTRSIR